jgi:hypothetical protein
MKTLKQRLDELPEDGEESTSQAHLKLGLERVVELLDTIRAMAWAILIALIALGIIIGIFAAAVVSWKNARDRSDRITGCRSAYNAELLAGPNGQGLKAAVETGSLRSPETLDAVGKMDPEEFQRLAELSYTDTDAFLGECGADFPD